MESSVRKKISRIVKQKMVVPAGVSYVVEDSKVVFSGPQGMTDIVFDNDISIHKEGDAVYLSSERLSNSLLGTYVVLFKNGLLGVANKFSKVMNLYGVGYKVLANGENLEFFLGYSHSIKLEVPKEISFTIKTPTQLILQSCSKAKLGDFAAKISRLRRVNPYKTKGVIAEGAFILKKEGKK